jgi:hypothetical protein
MPSCTTASRAGDDVAAHQREVGSYVFAEHNFYLRLVSLLRMRAKNA